MIEDTNKSFEIILLIFGLGSIIIPLIIKALKFIEIDENSKGYCLFAIFANMIGILTSVFGIIFCNDLSLVYNLRIIAIGINDNMLIILICIILLFVNFGFLINNIKFFKAKIRYERYEKHIKHCKNAIYENSDISDEVKSELCNIVGHYYINLNHYYDANHYFQKAIDYNPNNKVAKEYISTIEQKTDKTKHASERDITTTVTTVTEDSEETRKHKENIICSIPISLWIKIGNKNFLKMYYQVVAGKIANKIENKKELTDSDCTNAMEILELVSLHEPDLLNGIKNFNLSNNHLFINLKS